MALIALLVATLPAVAPADDFEERNIALWALRKGGRVLLQGSSEYVADPMNLPPGKVRIVGVDMHGTVVPPKELGPLSQLPELREIFSRPAFGAPLSTRNPSTPTRCSISLRTRRSWRSSKPA